MNQTEEKIIFQGSGKLGKQNSCLPLFLFIIVIIILIGIFFDIELITDILDTSFAKAIAFIVVVLALIFPRRLMKFLFSANKTSITLDIKIVETNPNGFYVLVRHNDNILTKYEYPFEYTYFRSIAVKTNTGQLYALNLLLFKDDTVLRFTNDITSSEECPIGWETSRLNLSPDTFAETIQVVEITDVIKELAKKYEHIKPAKEVDNVSTTNEIISTFHFKFNTDENTSSLLETKEGKKIIGFIGEYYFERRRINVNTYFFEDLGMTDEQFYMMLSKIELYYGINFPRHLLSQISTVGYLIQVVRYLKEVYD